ncbi:MAG: GNAT family N-acetyltransferase [Acidobacteriota bacterium]|nr:GNAT family N-acetyltransferase [Acidobacteriota bacterium]
MIRGKKVFFRAIEEGDLEALGEWANDPVISDLVVGWSFPVSMADQREWFEASRRDPATRRFIVESEEDGVLGLTGLWNIDWHNRHALTALKLGSASVRGKGYGTDAIMTLMKYAFFEVGLNRLWSAILPYNIGSYKAYVEKCGWKVEGRLRQEIFRHGKYHDLYRVAVIREDLMAHPLFDEYVSAADRGEGRAEFQVPKDSRGW